MAAMGACSGLGTRVSLLPAFGPRGHGRLPAWLTATWGCRVPGGSVAGAALAGRWGAVSFLEGLSLRGDATYQGPGTSGRGLVFSSRKGNTHVRPPRASVSHVSRTRVPACVTTVHCAHIQPSSGTAMVPCLMLLVLECVRALCVLFHGARMFVWTWNPLFNQLPTDGRSGCFPSFDAISSILACGLTEGFSFPG